MYEGYYKQSVIALIFTGVMVFIYFASIFTLPYDCTDRLEAQKRGDYNWESIDCQ